MDNCDEKPPSKTIVDIGSTDIPFDDIKGKPRMGFWDRLAQPVLYPAGSAVSSRCLAFFMDIQKK